MSSFDKLPEPIRKLAESIDKAGMKPYYDGEYCKQHNKHSPCPICSDPLEKWRTIVMARIIYIHGDKMANELKILLDELREKRELIKKLQERGLMIG